MSWAEVKKLNSDLSTPLNLAALINHIDLVGSSYVGYGDIPLTVEILSGDTVYAHQIAKETLTEIMLENSTLTTAVIANPSAVNRCLRDTYVNSQIIGESAVETYCDAMLGEPTGVGSWLAFICNSDNATLIACADIDAIIASETAMNVIASSETAMNAILASETAMNAVAASETAMNAIVASETAISKIITNDQVLYSIAVNNDTSLGLSKLASGIEGMATTAWEDDTKWGTIKTTLDASSLFTKSGLLTDTGGTHNRTGNLITLIESAHSGNVNGASASITSKYTGCYTHVYTNNWSTGKHIMWGGHSSTVQHADPGYCHVKHYMYTPII